VSPLIATITGWLAAALMAGTIFAALLTRITIARRPGGSGRLYTSGWHYRLGGAAALAGATHCLLSVNRAELPALQSIGNWASAGAGGALLLGAFVGWTVREGASSQRRGAKNYHLAAISLAAVLGTLHALLNGF
jgi:hypothetical protein